MLDFAEFSAAVGTRFRARVTAAENAVFELTQATPGRAPGSSAGKRPVYESFSLLFRGPAQPLFPQGTYSFEHDQLGSFSMFIVPIGRESDAVVYQAVFNRLVHPPRTTPAG
jgi:hypothetical protein